jgi:sugar fermentation stimulation protein A
MGRFISRPNRFVAHVCLDGETVVCHVKNTGRCRELLVPDTQLVLARSTNPARKTAYDLIAVYKGDKLINIDSQAPNRVFHEWAKSGGFLKDITYIHPETFYGKSRLDFYLETSDSRCLVEVKGVTLEDEGKVLFPDAPTLRGARHLKELTAAALLGYACYVVFVIQMHGVHSFSPNDATDPAFGKALREAAAHNVHVLAYDCRVTEDLLEMGQPVPVLL